MQIDVKKLKKNYSDGINKNTFILGPINVSFEQGEFISVIGPTGSGKTTFIEHINVLSVPTEGSIEYNYELIAPKSKEKLIKKYEKKLTFLYENEEAKFYAKKLEIKKSIFKKSLKDIRKRVGIVFQFAEYQLFEDTIEKDIIFGPINMGVPKEEAKALAKEMLIKVGLGEEYLSRSPFSLSGGQKRRVALAGILSIKPDFLIFDEPTAGLDPAGAQEILSLFKKLNQQGNTIIIVTHDMDNALKWTRRTLFFADGKIIKDGKTIDILEDTDFLEKNNMEPPKLLALRTKLIKRGLDIPHVKNIDELANVINKIRGEKG